MNVSCVRFSFSFLLIYTKLKNKEIEEQIDMHFHWFRLGASWINDCVVVCSCSKSVGCRGRGVCNGL
jgi:hypothetical protein